MQNAQSNKSIVQCLNELQKDGYNINFSVNNKELCDIDTDNKFATEDLVITHEFRFEGMSNPSDNSILYAIKSKTDDKVKGTILNSYGHDANVEIDEVMQKIETKKIEHL